MCMFVGQHKVCSWVYRLVSLLCRPTTTCPAPTRKLHSHNLTLDTDGLSTTRQSAIACLCCSCVDPLQHVIFPQEHCTRIIMPQLTGTPENMPVNRCLCLVLACRPTTTCVCFRQGNVHSDNLTLTDTPYSKGVSHWLCIDHYTMYCSHQGTVRSHI